MVSTPRAVCIMPSRARVSLCMCAPPAPQLLTRVRCSVSCEPPGRSLNTFHGLIAVQPPPTAAAFAPLMAPPRRPSARTSLSDNGPAAAAAVAAAPAGGAGQAEADATVRDRDGGGDGGVAAAAAGDDGGDQADGGSPVRLPLSMDNLLLRGCVLKNSRCEGEWARS